MPTYLYECPVHGEFEHQHSISESLETCPLCLESSDSECHPPQKVKKLIASGGSFILSGGGWARDNYS
jgi:putative FmdB family regulatory protein